MSVIKGQLSTSGKSSPKKQKASSRSSGAQKRLIEEAAKKAKQKKKYKSPLKLALLIGAPHDGDLSMHNDVVAMYDALRMRGLAPEEILTLEGKLDRQILMGFLKGVSRRIAQWAEGELFLYFSGHGFFAGDTVEEARVGVQLRNVAQGDSEYCVYWDEIFAALSVPEAVILAILPDH